MGYIKVSFEDSKTHPETIVSNCDMCGKEIYLQRVSQIFEDGMVALDVTDSCGRCLRCRMDVQDTAKVIRRIASIGE